MKKVKRYHRDVYFPSWAKESAQKFFEEFSKRRGVLFSSHALSKIIGDSFKYGQIYVPFLFDSVRAENFSFESMFEFYATEDVIKKVCLRFSYKDLPADIIVVISADGTVVTSYTINKQDTHTSLNKNLYEKG